jgi:ribonuclease BN (tRNA processing enzyme)
MIQWRLNDRGDLSLTGPGRSGQLGTGMPTPITRAQKSTAWYVELGNGDIFLFDIGSGAAESLFALRPEFHRVDKIFASHQHTDLRGYA